MPFCQSGAFCAVDTGGFMPHSCDRGERTPENSVKYFLVIHSASFPSAQWSHVSCCCDLCLAPTVGFVRSGCRSCAWQCCRDGGGDDCGCGWCSCQRVWSLRVVDGSLCGILSRRVPLAGLLLQFFMCDCVGP